MSEHADVGVGVALLIERVDDDGRTCRMAAPDDQPSGLMQLGIQPWKEGDQGAGVENALALKAIDDGGSRRNVPVEHPEGAWLPSGRGPPGQRLQLA